MRIHPAMAGTQAPPVMEARRWVEGVVFPTDQPLLNVSQAAPVEPPPAPLREAIARFSVDEPQAHLYGPVLGLARLREAVAAEWCEAYAGSVEACDVAITSGCNQAFAAAVSTLAGTGDEVLLPSPWYFNHKMWLDMAGIRAVPLVCGAGMGPDVEAAAALITDKTRAIVLVTPNNPTGAEYPAGVVRAFFELCRDRGIALIVDETYRDFHSLEGPPHDLFSDLEWRETLIQLYSFSKAYRLTGHRVGAIVTSPERLAQVEKFLDTVAICANQLGQMAALWGMQNLKEWLGGERAEILARRAAIEQAVSALPGWEILGVGAYFAYLKHPYPMASDDLAKALVGAAGVLALPGTMFTPEGDVLGRQSLRIAFANIDETGIVELARRFGSLTL